MRRVAFFVLGLLSTAAIAAQQPILKFEVTSVKPSELGPRSFSVVFRGGRYTARYISLKRLIRSAYGSKNGLLMENQIVGGPEWLDVDHFDVEGTAPSTPSSSDSSLPSAVYMMLRQLLADRFSLKVHFEPRDRPLFSLVLANSDGSLGPGFRRRTVDCVPPLVLPAPKTDERTCFSQGGPGLISATGIAMPILVTVLSQHIPEVDRMVVDRTGLTGMFDIELRWTPDVSTGIGRASGELKYPSFFAALQEQLGLKLERTTGPVEVLVIDSVQRPTPN